LISISVNASTDGTARWPDIYWKGGDSIGASYSIQIFLPGGKTEGWPDGVGFSLRGHGAFLSFETVGAIIGFLIVGILVVWLWLIQIEKIRERHRAVG
jgi:hypothetical protein